jgi:hypothetical protein
MKSGTSGRGQRGVPRRESAKLLADIEIVPAWNPIEALIEQLQDPSRSNRALIALVAEGKAVVPSLAAFLCSSKRSGLPEARLLAVEALGILKGTFALDVLIGVAREPLAEIADPVVRLAEESVVSCAALALADFRDHRARETLLDLVKSKPLVGVAEAFEKLKDGRAMPYLVAWLEEDFVAEPTSRAILAFGQDAIPALMKSLGEKHCDHGTEMPLSQRRRARILEILNILAEPGAASVFELHMHEPADEVRFKALEGLLSHGSLNQQRRAFDSMLRLLDSQESSLRASAEELIRHHAGRCRDLLEAEIDRRRAAGESEDRFYPRASALSLLLRILEQSRS